MERLQKILSQAGVSSRRAGEKLMLEGRVTVNGTTVRELGTKADPESDDIRVDGRRIAIVTRHRYLLLNKPRGYMSTRSDPERRPTVIDLLRGVRDYLYPVGRLDFDSEGLLLLTNDGDLAARLTHPRHGVTRVYEARVLGVPDEHDLNRLRKGIVIDGEKTGPAEIVIAGGRPQPSPKVYARGRGLPARGGGAPRAVMNAGRLSRPAGGNQSRGSVEGRRTRSETTLIVTVREGRNRQVRKMCDAIGHPVTHLRRVAIGPIRDARLKLGQWRELSDEELKRLRAAAARTDAAERPRAVGPVPRAPSRKP
ncbi:MAG: pseudouridine synthase [Vicinamibacterales bacterium]